MGAKLAKILDIDQDKPRPLTEFRKHKLIHDFRTFFDLNKDGVLEWKDFDTARQHICQLSGWKPSDGRYDKTQKLFIQIWDSLVKVADTNFDGKISEDEWVEMWETYNRAYYEEQEKSKREKREPKKVLPEWLDLYVQYKFNLYDRTGDGAIDGDEFEFVLSDFGISKKDAKAAFLIFSEAGVHDDHGKEIDLATFQKLCEEYYLSDDPNDRGNFITGKLHFDSAEPCQKK